MRQQAREAAHWLLNLALEESRAANFILFQKQIVFFMIG
jgi:hypothetical protein